MQAHKDQECAKAHQKMMTDGPTKFIKINSPQIIKSEIFDLIGKTVEYIKDRWVDTDDK